MIDNNQFCTIVDRTFVTQALVLVRSLQATGQDFRLRAFCLDETSLALLRELGGRGTQVLDFERVERADPALCAVRDGRTRSEYCWTATPIVCRYVLSSEPELMTITYLDADLMFFGDPSPLLSELDGGSILLFPQRISWRLKGWSQDHARSEPAERLTRTYGSFNAGSISFRNDEHGHAALDWWRERCLEWCFDRKEPGRWADQRYLEEMPERFPGVRVCDHPGAALAPWNTNASALTRSGGTLLVDGTPALFHHYQSLRLLRSTGPRLLRLLPNLFILRVPGAGLVARHDRDYSLSGAERALVWTPYVAPLELATREVLERMPRYLEGVAVLGPGVIVRDSAQFVYLRLYGLAGKMLPRRLRVALSRTRAFLERCHRPGLQP